MNTLPRLLLNLFERIDCCGDEPIILRQEDVPTANKALLRDLIGQGLLTESISQSVTCIACDSVAEIKRSGPRGTRLTAVCGQCASVFAVTERDALEYRTGWTALTKWVAGILGVADDCDPLSEHAAYLGTRYIGDVEHEIFLACLLATNQSAETYKVISQALSANKAGMVYALGSRPAPPANKRLAAMHLSSALTKTVKGITSRKATIADRVKNPVRQAAGLARVSTDPAQQQKQILKDFIRKSLPGQFRDMYHTQIKAQIITDHKSRITYEGRDGQKKQLSNQMILDSAREVLTEIGLPEWISGLAHRP